MSIPAWACRGCGQVVFPRRYLCPACGCAAWLYARLAEGELEDTTGGIGTVRTDEGPVLIARHAGAQPGDRVSLSLQGDSITASLSEHKVR